MDPTSRRLVTRIASWTVAIIVLMGIYFFAIRPQIYPSGNELSGEATAPVASEDETPSDPAAANEIEGETGDRNAEGEAVDDDGSMVGPVPEAEEPAEEPQPDDPSDGQ